MSRALDLALRIGYLSAEEVEALETIARGLPQGARCVNIGAGAGTSSMCILEQRPDLVRFFTSIDITEKRNPYGGLENERLYFQQSGLGDLIPSQLQGDSKELGLLPRFDGRWISYLFIDGDHTEGGVRGDVAAWKPHVLIDGWIVFHDYGSKFWGIKPFIDEMMATDHLFAVVNTVAIYRVGDESLHQS